MKFQRGHTTSEEVRRKIGVASKGRKLMLGKKHTEETKKKIAMALKGKPLSAERRRNMSEAHKGNTISDDVKKKISESKKGKKRGCLSIEWKNNISKARKGKANKGTFKKGHIPWSKGTHIPEEYRRFGVRSPRWAGGQKLAEAKHRNKHRQRGFVLISNKNPYSEIIEYHHIYPNLPYVIPCPKRIHQMFNDGVDVQKHCDNVNFMLGIKFEPRLIL